jgi:hypothetical protein
MRLCKITGHYWKHNYELILKDDPLLTEVRMCSFCKRKQYLGYDSRIHGIEEIWIDIVVEPTLADKRDMKLRQLGIK